MSYAPVAYAAAPPRVIGLDGYNAFDPRNAITFSLAYGFTPSPGATRGVTRLHIYSYDRSQIIYDSGFVAPDTLDFTVPALTARFGENLGVLVSFDNLVEGTGGLLGLPTTARFSMLTGGIIFAGVPEPMTWAMLVVGFGAVGVAVRRRYVPT
ncbi:PEP-CTERM sorting domain-containing protein [Glacieibacterium frigidum]|uniref:PEP-CTERM sorting domain-containing protein n=2 Tax=Glacieibacterium frigidum TaxID=2593303 RepID=A0A552UJU6_9SPHN|nr:PEP-CTERM sorting domain-containing protein [Glacieibacterium frigidum]